MKGLFLFLFLFSCATRQNYELDYYRKISEKNCEAAQELIPLEKDDTKYLRFYKTTMGYTASIPMLSASVVLDLLLVGRCQYGGCRGDEFEEVFPVTSFTYEHTKDLRCPDNSYYIHKFLEVARCYEGRETLSSLETAQSQVDFLLKTYKDGPSCIQHRDGNVLEHASIRLEHKIYDLLAKEKEANLKK